MKLAKESKKEGRKQDAVGTNKRDKSDGGERNSKGSTAAITATDEDLD